MLERTIEVERVPFTEEEKLRLRELFAHHGFNLLLQIMASKVAEHLADSVSDNPPERAMDQAEFYGRVNEVLAEIRNGADPDGTGEQLGLTKVTLRFLPCQPLEKPQPPSL